jgi:NTE family protein
LTRHRYSLSVLLSLALSFFILSGCAHYPLNQPLDPNHPSGRYDFKQFDNAENGDSTFVVLTFSGGGTRAAALAYGVLDKLRKTKMPGSNKRLLDNVNIISTVSGGSFTGAYYALFGDRIFDDFKDKFLYRNVQGELGSQLLKPANWVRLMSPNYSRINLAAELYDKTIFESKTFASLAEKARPPFLIINATNMARGTQFEFTSRQFDYIGSDILPWPIAQAVAASSAFPLLLSPVSLKNYVNAATFKISADDLDAMKDCQDNKRRYNAAKNNLTYINSKEHPYVHLIDGSVADNLGLRAVYSLFESKELRQKIDTDRIKRLLVIIVNSRTDRFYDIDKNESPPGILKVGLKAFTIPMNNYSFEIIELFKAMLQEKIKARETAASCQELLDAHCKDGFRIPEPAGGRVKLYVAEIAFENLTDQAEKDYFNSLPTSFSLKKEDVEKLIDVGARMLADNPSFKQFMKEYSPD